MRRSDMESGWYLDEDGSLLGMSLGYDFCAEHEEGVKHLRRRFALPEGLPEGLKDRKIRQVPAELAFVEFTLKPRDRRRKAYACALLASAPQIIQKVRQGRYLTFYSDPTDKFYSPRHDLACAWSVSEFAILVRGAENLGHLAELHEAFQRLDILFGTTVASFVQRRGLTFMLDSRVAEEARQNVLAEDLEHKRLVAVAAATGIEDRLKAAGRRWFALSPAWADEARETVRFWLNPMEQRKYNCGWYTVEQLEAWAAGQGPIVKESGTA